RGPFLRSAGPPGGSPAANRALVRRYSRMGLDFDPRTIFLVAACTAALGSVTFLALQPIHPRSAAVLRRHAMAMAVMSAALLLFALRDALLPSFTHVAPNILATLGIALCADATVRTFDRDPPQRWLALQALAIVALWIAIGNDPADSLARVLVFSILHAAYGFGIVVALTRNPAWGGERYVRVLGAAFATYATAHVLRGGLALAGGSPAGGATAPGVAQVAFILLFALMPIVLALVLQTILHARVTGELRVRATTDELTGLYTRGHFFELARRHLAHPPAGRTVHH